MSNGDKQIYLGRQRERYKELMSRKSKTDLITEVVEYLKISRNHAIRCLNGRSRLRERKSGPSFKYGQSLVPHLKRLYYLMRQPCSRRMRDAIPLWLDSYEKRFGIIDPDIRKKILTISPASIDRLFKESRIQRGKATTTAPKTSWYKAHVPIRAKDWNIKSPGHLQGDTVSHCGESGQGIFASTLTLTDIDSGWTENRAFLSKTAPKIREALGSVEKKLPFIIRSIKFDSGSEFMNFGVISFLRSTYARKEPIEIFRSRPYRKNDQCYVEQKNFTHVRDLLGYDRIESPEIVSLMNVIYSYWNPLSNHFLPQMKLQRKERIGARIKKYYEKPQTPYQRLLDSSDLNESQKHLLRQTHEALDPIELQLGLEEKLRQYFDQVRKSTSGSLKAA